MTARKGMRAGLAGVAAWAVLAGVSAAQSGPAAGTSPVAALVNGVPVTTAELDWVVSSVTKQRPNLPQSAKLTPEQELQLKGDALTMLIDDLLMQQFLQKNGPRVDQAEVDKTIGSLEAGLKAQGKTLQDFAKGNGQTEAQLRGQVYTMLQWTHYAADHLPEADLKRYYEEYRDFFEDVRVRASHILIRPKNPTPQERELARGQLQNLRADILAGKIDFADAARKYSVCPTASKGGDLDYFQRKFAFHENFARAAFALKPGEVSDVVETDAGLHLIKVTDRKKFSDPPGFDKIKDMVRELASSELHQAVLTQERKTAQVEIKVAGLKKP